MKETDKLRLIDEMKRGDDGALQEVLQGLTEELTEAGWDEKSARLDAIGWLATRVVLDTLADAMRYDNNAKSGVQQAKRSKDARFKHSWVARVVDGAEQGMRGPLQRLTADKEVATHIRLRLAYPGTAGGRILPPCRDLK